MGGDAVTAGNEFSMTPGTGAEHRETLKMDVPDGARHTPGVLGPCVAAAQ